MAIIRSLAVGKARKSAGNLTFSTVKGRTIAREKPAFVSNPNTPKQQLQRSKMRKVVAAYRSIGAQVRDLFTVVPQYGSSYNQFVKSNIGIADNFEIDETTGNVKNITGMCISNGVYPSGSFVIQVTDTAVKGHIANLQLRNEIKAGDMIYVVGTPVGVDEYPQVYTTVVTESDIEGFFPEAAVIGISNLPKLSNAALAWYSPTTHRSSTAYVVDYNEAGD